MKLFSKKIIFFGLIIIYCFNFVLQASTTGKISGMVVDKATGEPLPGANVIVLGTTLGTAVDMDGYYTILNLLPDLYDVEFNYIGYKKVTITDVRVQIDQTARVNVEMEVEAIEGETVTVIAERDLLRDDVATSVVAVTGEEVETLPVSSVDNVVGLQAGIKGGLEIRGTRSDQALVLMDGVTLRDPRNNNAVSSLPLSSIQEVSVERGGFNAEYGQVRSGIVKIVTREGGKHSYYGNIEFKYSPYQKKYFGISPYDRDSWWFRPYFDDAVCWQGTLTDIYQDRNNNGIFDEGDRLEEDYNGDGEYTESPWDVYTQKHYEKFKGWNYIAAQYNKTFLDDTIPSNDYLAITPEEAQRIFDYQTRRRPVEQPDFNIDAGFGGPVPFIGKYLGDLRFFSAFRKNRSMLLVPLTRDDYVDYDWTLKLTSDISSSMKLTISSLFGKQFTMARNEVGDDPDGWLWRNRYIRSNEDVASVIGAVYTDFFGTGVFSPTDISHQNLGAKLIHTLSATSFYEVSLEYFKRDYLSGSATRRDTTKFEIVPDYYVDEAPYGFRPLEEFAIAGENFKMGGGSCRWRDTTKVSSITFKADLTSQVNHSNLVKMGVEFVYNDLDFNYGRLGYNDPLEKNYIERVQFKTEPLRAALYLQDKLETKGFIMNIGLRLDYSNSNTDWWDVNWWDRDFMNKYSEDAEYPKKESKAQWQLSPRLSIAHPISRNTKLFFNYGHFKQMPTYESLFRLGRDQNQVMRIFGDPNLTLAKTISYELGVDYTLYNDYLIQMAGFYKDILNNQLNVLYDNRRTNVYYYQTTSNEYQDIRGFELTLRKSQGRWWTFFANYTYQAIRYGHFGKVKITTDRNVQRNEYDKDDRNRANEGRPVPAPFARANISFFTPDDYGPSWMGIYPVGGLLLNLLGSWEAGRWVPGDPDKSFIQNNVQETDHWNTQLRFSKTFQMNKFRIQAFIDINNLINYKRMSFQDMVSAEDRTSYYHSLHLPESDDYGNIPGDDRVGTYNRSNYYQPMEPLGRIDFNNEEIIGDAGVIYYDKPTKRYVEYIENPEGTVNDDGSENPGDWVDIEKGRLNKILEDKAYINMPSQTSFTFLNPRQIFYGIRISFDFN
jgi:outer membrane receptor protein involved in Fe transport